MISFSEMIIQKLVKRLNGREVYKLRQFSGYTQSSTPVTFHKRPLPDTLTALSSPKGKLLFREALLAGDMECFFPLSEQFVTQSEPSFCALSSLVVVLNALNHDPKKIWKGIWRWVSEETLQCESRDVCGHTLEKVKQEGMNFNEFENIARCHGVRIQSFRAHPHYAELPHRNNETNLELFRTHVRQSCRQDSAENFIVTNFSRKAIGQTGDGHFSPIGGYHASNDLVLIMDVARFKYPPFWLPLTQLWESMSQTDKQTDECRGYFIISSPGIQVQGSTHSSTSTSSVCASAILQSTPICRTAAGDSCESVEPSLLSTSAPMPCASPPHSFPHERRHCHHHSVDVNASKQVH